MKQTDQTDFEQWLRERLPHLPEPEVSPEFLAAQRRSIYRRLDLPHGSPHMRWGLSLAMLLLMVAGGLTLERVHKTQPVVSTPLSSISDDQLFSDLSAMEQRNEPKAIQPMHGLFRE
ncbi:MAG: hypothetical protein WBE37_03915 [Bryobacteraceae bacterium]